MYRRTAWLLARVSIAALALCTGTSSARDQNEGASTVHPWMERSRNAAERANLVLHEMSDAEKLRLVLGYLGSAYQRKELPAPPLARSSSAGFVAGIPRLEIPPLWETDAGLGVATQSEPMKFRERTSLASGLALTATWNPQLAFRSGAMIGAEARDSGFNVMLAGAVNLAREPRNGRNFEYAGEDPLLAGTMVGEQVRGIQSAHIISTVKHFALNDQETGRMVLSADIAEDQARISDLLAFQIAIERGDPGAVMCAYNRINGIYACENAWLLERVLKGDWRYRGWVMSDWGSVHSSVQAVSAGLDQESGYVYDPEPYFGAPLAEALARGAVSRDRLDDMARRILLSMFAKGVVDFPVAENEAGIDFAAHAAVAQAGAEEGLVLLKNAAHLLPLSQATTTTIAVIGSHADAGVLSGGGSAQVYPRGGPAVQGLEPRKFPGPVIYFPDSPLEAIRALAARANVRYDRGESVESAVKLAGESDLVILFAHQWATETLDPSLTLPEDQDRLIEAVARANPRTVVVLETGGPVLMPWLDHVRAVLEAWYPGTRGGQAIAQILFGQVVPSGHLPISFPRSLQDLPRPALAGEGRASDQPFSIAYTEGAAVGYKWFESRALQPLFPFGHGLTYTHFNYAHPRAFLTGGTIEVTFDVKNEGLVDGKEVAQLYVAPGDGAGQSHGWEAPKRLAGWRKLNLQRGAVGHVRITVDPRLLSLWDIESHSWRISAGVYRVMIGASAADIRATATVRLPSSSLPASFVFSAPGW